jgi:hypothetical protein
MLYGCLHCSVIFPLRRHIRSRGLLTVVHSVDCRYVAAHGLHYKRGHLVPDIPQSKLSQWNVAYGERLTRGRPITSQMQALGLPNACKSYMAGNRQDTRVGYKRV